MFWGKSKRKLSKKRDLHLQTVMASSQQNLLSAAIDAANAAQDVTLCLKSKLDDSIRQFENTARILNDALLLTDVDGQIQSCNPAAGRMFGRTDLIGTNLSELFRLGERAPSAQTFWYLAEETSAWLPGAAEPLRAVRPDGVLMWIEPTTTRLDWSSGAASMLILIRNMDPVVTLADSAKQGRGYKAAFDAASEAILIEQYDRIVAANPAVTRMFGHGAEDILNRPISLLFESSDHARVEANGAAHFGAQGLCSDGTHLTLIFAATDIVWKGRPARLITLRDAALEALPVIPRTDNGVDMLCCFDTSYRITFANESFARYCGLSRAEIRGEDLRLILSPDAALALLANTGSLRPDRPTSRFQDCVAGQAFDWIDHAIFDEDGSTLEYQRTGRNVTTLQA
jgi:PAS domain S-box-containing protein